MRTIIISFLFMALLYNITFAQKAPQVLRGDSAAIADARAMVERMGGREIWSQLKSIHFVHEWFPCYQVDTYVENEILDLMAPRSRADRKSEISHTIRVYSPEGRHWTIKDGKFAYSSEEIFKSAMERAPFNFYHLVRAIAIGDSFYEVRFGASDIPGMQRLEFYDPAGNLGAWVILNSRKEPIVKATPQYRYTLGPLKRYGNLWIPAWGVYDTGLTRYEMISVSAGNQPPDSSLFMPPEEVR